MSSTPTRLDLELSLLSAMYPSQTTYTAATRELTFTHAGASLTLRLPSGYPAHGHPDITSATSATKADLRSHFRATVQALALPEGEECLDAILGAFTTLPSSSPPRSHPPTPTSPKTVIVWLHHLLAPSKRKMALSPPPGSCIAGITKPGYPGVLVYSAADGAALDAHVAELRAQKWQAFVVRFEEGVEWVMKHEGVREVESLAEVVAGVDWGGQKEVFLRAVGIK